MIRALIIVALLLAADIGIPISARAHDGEDPISAWYRDLKQPSGASCCNMTDCSPVDYRISPDGYEARVDGQWLSIPSVTVIRGKSNPVGRAVLCRSPATGAIFCFVPASET